MIAIMQTFKVRFYVLNIFIYHITKVFFIGFQSGE